MCGIFGTINYRISEEKALDCLNRMIHRGPDGYGIWQEDGVTLGHRRLSILDLSENGSQPMSYADGRYEITFNGEVYNFIEIRRELISKGYTFKSDTDTEVIIAAFIEWGEKCLDMFNGMWTFAIWDRLEKKMFISRDRFGIKPLYIANQGGRIAFASEMKAIMPLLDKADINRSLIERYLKNPHYEMQDECLVEEIKRFPAGYCAWVDESGNIEMKRWWNTLDHIVDVPATYEEQVEKFRELFLDSCRIRMRSDVTLGTALSGGLDSSATICAMAHIMNGTDNDRVNNDWQHAFVATFAGTPFDETRYARQVTDHLGINSTFLNIDESVSYDELLNKTYLFEDLWVNTQIPMMKIYEQERKHGTLVSLDGHGADELYCGYNFDALRALPDAHFKMHDVDNIIRAYVDQLSDKDADVHSSEFKKKRNRIYADNLIHYYGRRILGKPAIDSSYTGHPAWKELDNLNKALFVSTHETVLPTLLRNYDRDSMAASVEIRMPFMDYRLVQYAFSIGWKSKLHDGYTKSIIRDAMAPFMPKDIAYRRTKVGFNAPINNWMKTCYREMFTDIMNSADFMNCYLIDNPAQVKADFEKVLNDDSVSFSFACYHVWNKLQLFLWEQAFIKEKGRR